MDLELGQLEQTSGTGEDAKRYENNDGAQSGGTRSPRHAPGSGVKHNTEPAVAAFEGQVTTRVPRDPSKQGISSNSSAKENEGQQKVVSQRKDAQAGVNHSRKTPD